MENKVTLATKVGKALRGRRRELKMSQEELAKKARLHPTYIGQVERGEKNVTIHSLEKIAKAMDVSISSIFLECEGNRPADSYPDLQFLTKYPVEEREQLMNIIREVLLYKPS